MNECLLTKFWGCYYSVNEITSLINFNEIIFQNKIIYYLLTLSQKKYVIISCLYMCVPISVKTVAVLVQCPMDQ